MALPLPSSLSPSGVAAFKDCALSYRFAVIDRLPERPAPWSSKGTLVHRALERLYAEEPPGRRTPAAAQAKLALAWDELAAEPGFAGLELDGEVLDAFLADAGSLVANLFRLEDPNAVRAIGLELKLEARLGDLRLRGVIDRLDLDADGELVVTDYKTGSAPAAGWEHGRLAGVQFYAYLCEQMLGRRPARVQLLHLREPVAIIGRPDEQSVRGLVTRTSAVWQAVELACVEDDFRPRPSGLCGWCGYQAYCPAAGGDPAAARQAGAA
ncbi:MAG TPA: PD-(D/E)XK nuclease family protein [Acidimicrobiales bacterium]|nr:PD-(D/E)XK nuclease family protein [Acidimicrobiales bacterium]